MEDRRTPACTFTSERALKRFFSPSLSKTAIKEVVETVRKRFVPRSGTLAGDDKLEFLKKCEYELLRLLHKLPVSPPGR